MEPIWFVQLVGGLAAAGGGGESEVRSEQRGRSQTWVVVGLDNGGTSNNATVLDATGRFLVQRLCEVPSRVDEGPTVAIDSLAELFENVLHLCGVERSAVRAIGLDTPGPASARGVISTVGSTNFVNPRWKGFDFRDALEQRLKIQVTYNNDGNAAALYAHHVYFGAEASSRSSVSAIVGTGLGGGVIEMGQVICGAAGMAGELGHVHIPMEGLLSEGQPPPVCNCGFVGDVESVASLTAIEKNLLPYWFTRYPDHELVNMTPIGQAAKFVRDFGVAGDPMALAIFEQQAIALGRLFTIASNFVDPDAYFVGGGVVETPLEFRTWLLDKVKVNTTLRPEQLGAAFEVIPDLDMAGARGAALAALAACMG